MKNADFYGLNKAFVIGMVHSLPLPGTAGFKNNIDKIISQAIQDAHTLEAAGVDAIIVENMGDGPLAVKLDMGQVVALAVVASRVKEAVNIPIGIDAAFNDYEAALAIAKAVNASFVRVPVFVDTVVFHGGVVEPCARDAVLYRKALQAESVRILADIQVKHTHMLIQGVSIEASAKNAVAAGADGVIVTGTTTGAETPLELIQRVKKVINVPVIAGSGVNAENIQKQLTIADGAIIGSSLKEGGVISNPISLDLTKQVLAGLHRGKAR